VPQLSSIKTGKTVAVVGSGPAGMAAAQQLARVGHTVTLFEKNAKIGGLLRYGIPDFKMEKSVIDRRLAQMEAEGVVFRTGIHIGVDLTASALLESFDAVLLACGSELPRDLPVPGRDLDGVHFAMDFLGQSNRRVSGENYFTKDISAKGKHVLVIGGGDTGSDCVGTSNRQGAASVTQLEILAKPPVSENKGLSWPLWPNRLRTSSSHEEGCERRWGITGIGFDGKDGHVTAMQGIEVGRDLKPIVGTEFSLKADLVLLAMGFVHPVRDGLLTDLGLAFDGRGNVSANTEDYATSIPKVFAAGDVRRGQSLVVWAIREGRQAARAVDSFLTGRSDLPR
jgi:glutamate synthase (NADPH/NADH) small chain